MLKSLIIAFGLSVVAIPQLFAQSTKQADTVWPPISSEARPYTRWWWLGSAVDSTGLAYNLREMARVGIGGVEITPIYGVQGNDANEIPYLSPRWMRMLGYVQSLGAELGLETNMATGTGWPFGGPTVPQNEGASRLIMPNDTKAKAEDKLFPIAGAAPGFYAGRTRQQVKRAAPGGEGLVIDHFDSLSVAHYLQRFDTAFVHQQTPWPHTFFNDSYEVYGADWTPQLPEAFTALHGYDLRSRLDVLARPDSLRTDEDRRILSDYRETLANLLYKNFTTQWTEWAHSHGAITRNQAHGSPANLLDLYAAVDIPECEGFGLSDFGIKGLRTDPGFTKKNFSDLSMLKYASSGAHLSGNTYTSSETFTWLTEHFRTSLSQCKPDLDLMFVSGVNHVFFHGSCYSPADAPWPGWRFYASVDMSPNNPQWSEALPAFNNYVARSQTFLQWGRPDNDFLVYLPFYDMIYEQPGTAALFDIHSMEERAPRFIATIQSIIQGGYDVDYVSDRHLLTATATAKRLVHTAGGSDYAAIIIPDVRFMPIETLNHLNELATQGIRVIFVGHWPQSEPGLGRNTEARRQQFASVMQQLQSRATLAPDYGQALSAAGGRREPMRTEQGLSCIRRSNDFGHHYFIANLTPNDIDTDVALGVDFKLAELYNPMTSAIGLAESNTPGKVRLQLRSGESIILRTYADAAPYVATRYAYENHDGESVQELSNWTLSFPSAAPSPISRTYKMKQPQSWTELGDSALLTTMATGCYATKLKLKPDTAHRYILDLGDVRESARVIVNGEVADTLFAVPFRCDITPYLHRGNNTIEVHVTNLPANRIAQLDREGVQWRHFKEINVVDLNYKRTLYDAWEPVPSGLNGCVRLIIQNN